MTGSKIRKYAIEAIVVTSAGILVTFIIVKEVADPFIVNIQEMLFSLFFPGIWVGILLSGGPHDATKIGFIFGVVFQLSLMYLAGRVFVVYFLLSNDVETQESKNSE